MLAGVVGLVALVVKDHLKHAEVLRLTEVFGFLIGLGIVFIFLGVLDGSQSLLYGGLLYVAVSFSLLSILYCDWALGIITDNICGLPSSDTAALNWAYWISKRLTMFSF